jgi:hypothetical protein
VAAGLLAAVLTVAAPAQDPEGPPPVPPVPPVPIGEVDPEAGRNEMIELFMQVEQRLREIDQLLFDASAGEVLDEDVEEAGIGDLLRQSTSKAEEVVQGIDRILEIAQQQGGAQQAMQGQSQGDKPQGSPLDKQQGQQGEQGEKEQTPEAPGDKQQQPSQEPKGGDEPHEEPGKSGQPKSPLESDEESRNEENQPPAGDETGSGTRTVDTTERWGDLPIHVRDLFRSEGGGDMPPQYRDWIDAYYRRLNQRP